MSPMKSRIILDYIYFYKGVIVGLFMGKNLKDYFESKGIDWDQLGSQLTHVATTLANRASSCLDHVKEDLISQHGLRHITNLQLLEYVKTLERIGLVEFETRTELYRLTKKGCEFYE